MEYVLAIIIILLIVTTAVFIGCKILLCCMKFIDEIKALKKLKHNNISIIYIKKLNNAVNEIYERNGVSYEVSKDYNKINMKISKQDNEYTLVIKSNYTILLYYTKNKWWSYLDIKNTIPVKLAEHINMILDEFINDLPKLIEEKEDEMLRDFM